MPIYEILASASASAGASSGRSDDDNDARRRSGSLERGGPGCAAAARTSAADSTLAEPLSPLLPSETGEFAAAGPAEVAFTPAAAKEGVAVIAGAGSASLVFAWRNFEREEGPAVVAEAGISGMGVQAP